MNVLSAGVRPVQLDAKAHSKENGEHRSGLRGEKQDHPLMNCETDGPTDGLGVRDGVAASEMDDDHPQDRDTSENVEHEEPIGSGNQPEGGSRRRGGGRADCRGHHGPRFFGSVSRTRMVHA